MQHTSTAPLPNVSLALSLSGGSALGAYQAGAYQTLHERGFAPDWITGASIGAINGAVICGNPPERCLDALRALWRTNGRSDLAPASEWQPLEEARRTQAVLTALATGDADWFLPRSLYGPWWNPFGNPEPASLYDTSPLERRLEQLVDFELLNRGSPRFSATAIDVEKGTDIVYDTHTHVLTAKHLRAVGGLMPVFSPVEVEGRLIGDAGLSANLPLDLVLGARSDRPVLCIAIDLLSLRAPRPRSLGGVAARAQDLMFASQSRRAIAAWQAIFAERARHGSTESVTLLHISYADHSREVSGKAFDFSRESASARWLAGSTDARRALDALDAQSLPIGEPGLHAFALETSDESGPRLEQIEWQLTPEPA